jgi:hypothetical protein
MGGGLLTNNHVQRLEVRTGHSFRSPLSHRTLVAISALGHPRPIDDVCAVSAFPPIASLIGHSGSSAFRPTTTAVSMSVTGSCFSSESAPGPSIMGVEDEAEQSTERPCCNERQVQAIGRTHLIHRPARDIIPPQGGARVSSYRI